MVIAKATILKSILVDQPAYERCLSGSVNPGAAACGTDPLVYFMIGGIITAGGAIVLIYGLKSGQKIPR